MFHCNRLDEDEYKYMSDSDNERLQGYKKIKCYNRNITIIFDKL